MDGSYRVHSTGCGRRTRSAPPITATTTRAERVAEHLPRQHQAAKAPTRHAAARAPGAFGGRTPRQRKNDSAACSTSMPRPSRGARPGLARRGEERGLAPVDHLVRERRLWIRREAEAAEPRPTSPAEVALMTTSNAHRRALRSCTPRRRRSARRARSLAAPCDWRRPGDRAPASSSAPITPCAAPPAPSSRTLRPCSGHAEIVRGRAPARRRRCCRRSRSSKTSVFTTRGKPGALADVARRARRPAP